MGKRKLFVSILLFCMFGLMVLADRQPSYAEKTGDFTGDVSVLKAEDDAYVLQVQVKNSGPDFDGTVRLGFFNVETSCVFDTKLTLPKDGAKQFTLTVPKENADSVRGSGALYFLDKDEKELQKITFKNIFKGQKIGISVGVLSDHFDKLTYMDMGGTGYSLGSVRQPVNLVELDADSIKDSLNGLYFLIIDSYNVSTLDKDSIEAIESWVKKGGALILGTGERAEDALNAFAPDFTGLEAVNVSKPGEENYLVSAGGQTSYYNYEDSKINFANMAVAELKVSGNSASPDEAGCSPGKICYYGNGSILVLAISLCDDEMQKASSDLCQEIYNEVGNFASMATNYYEGSSYEQMQAFHLIDNENTDVNFTWLEILIFIYVVLVGPVLYLVLARLKKREWYWLGAPALALVFIGGVLVFGRGLRVADTKVYSVTLQRLDGKEKGKTDTLFSAYHSGVKPWKLKLKDQFEYAGTKTNWGYFGSADDWKYRVVYGDGIEIGMSPDANFETGFLYASGNIQEDWGKLEAKKLSLSAGKQSGSIINHTKFNFPYLLVASDDYLIILKDVKKGETVELVKAGKDGRVVYQSDDAYMNDLLYSLQGMGMTTIKNQDKDRQLYAALAAGMYDARRKAQYGANQAVICGIVPDYKKTVADKCTEISFACPYAVAEQEVNGASN